MLNWLEAQPGGSWQDRWLASGAEGQQDWRGLVAAWKAARSGSAPGPAPAAHRRRADAAHLRRCDPPRHRLAAALLTHPAQPGRRDGPHPRQCRVRRADALMPGRLGGLLCPARRPDKIAVIMAAKGGLAADITVGDCAELLGIAAQTRTGTDRHSSSPFFYQLLRSLGHVRPGRARDDAGLRRPRPAHLRAADRPLPHPVPARSATCWWTTCANARQRWTSPPCSTTPTCSASCSGPTSKPTTPGISSLKLPRDVAAAWKQRVMTRTMTRPGPDGEPVTTTAPRRDGRSVLTAVRAFYLDIAEWADDDPARWGPHAVRCPVTASEASHKKDRSPAQVPDGPADPGTAAGPARPGRLGRGRAGRRRAAAAGRRQRRSRRAVHRRRADAAPGDHENPDQRPDLGRRPGRPASAGT